MKHLFPEYYRPSKREFDALWTECLFFLDSNILLNLYRLSAETRNDFLSILAKERIRKRVRIPYQVAYEYQRRRRAVLVEQYQSQERVFNELDQQVSKEVQHLAEFVDSKAQEVQALDKFKSKQRIDIQANLEAIQEQFGLIRQRLLREREAISFDTEQDPIRLTLDKLFSGKVGEPYDEQRLKEIFEEGKRRFLGRVPQGHLEYQKATGLASGSVTPNIANECGNLILWFQVLDMARAARKPVVFVTGDQKDDWFQVVRGRTVGPRPELLRELYEASGKGGYIFNMVTFYEQAKRYLKENVSKASVLELKSLDRPKREVEESQGFRALEQRAPEQGSNWEAASTSLAGATRQQALRQRPIRTSPDGYAVRTQDHSLPETESQVAESGLELDLHKRSLDDFRRRIAELTVQEAQLNRKIPDPIVVLNNEQLGAGFDD